MASNSASACPPRILSIAGSDSSGGAGIQADIKTAMALGAYAMTAITAVTAQDTTGVYAVELMPPALVVKQVEACLNDIGVDAIKIGMLGSGAIASAVANTLRDTAKSIPIVLDPVLVSTSGTLLLDEAGVKILREEFIPLATVVTPNIPEAQALTGVACSDVADTIRSCDALLNLGANAVLVKGGHGEGDLLFDVLKSQRDLAVLEFPRIHTRHTHGTGCVYATAIAVGLARNLPLIETVERAREYLQSAIETAPGFGRGHGPLNHMHE